MSKEEQTQRSAKNKKGRNDEYKLKNAKNTTQPAKTKKSKKTEGMPRKEFKQRNREIFSKVEQGDLKQLAVLRKAMKRNGVMLKSDGLTGFEMDNHGSAKTQSRFQHNANTSNVGDPINNFIKALQTPGVYDTPFIDSSQVVPLPHGVSTGVPRLYTATVSDYNVFFLCTALSFAQAPSLVSQFAGFNRASYASTAVAITEAQITGTAGDWVTCWGNTTAAQRVVPWSMALDLCLRIPEAVVQGQFWIGNAPFRTVAGSTVGNLLQMSETINMEKAGATYTIKNSLLDRSLVHSPYGALTDATDLTTYYDYPGEERVSWIIFSPSSIGTISGTSPTSYDIQYQARCNYLWIPAFQPQVVGTTVGQVSAESHSMLDPYRKASLEIESNVEASNPHDPRSDMAKWCPNLNPSAFQKKLETSSIAAPGGPEISDPLSGYRMYCSNISDLDYYMQSINSRWGDWSKYSSPLPTAISDCMDSMQRLKDLFMDADNRTIMVLDDFNSGTAEVSFCKGKPVLSRISKSGKILRSSDGEKNVERAERPKSTDSSFSYPQPQLIRR